MRLALPAPASTRNKRIVLYALATVSLLMVPLVAMQFSEDWDWGPADFVFMGVLLFGSGLTFELVAGRATNSAYRFAVGVAVVTALLLVWVNGAVGIIGDENPANMLYVLVPAVGTIGAVASRLRPAGMARVLFAMALAQLLVPVVGLIFWGPWDYSWAPGVPQVFLLNAFFAALFVASGLLFQRATAESAPQVAI